MATKRTPDPPSEAVARLQAFLGGFERSTSREYLLTTRLIHDLSVAAAMRGYDLRVYVPTVDADGFDVIFDDQDRLVAVQLKSMVAGGKTSSWNVHRSLLRPEPDEADLFGFEPSPLGNGRGGGVILITAAAHGEVVDVAYAYTDVAVLSLYWEEILVRPAPQTERLRRLRHELEQDTSGTVELSRSAFLRVPSPSALLGVLGLHSTIQTSWRSLLRHVLRQQNLGVAAPAPLDHLRATIAAEIASLVGTGAIAADIDE